MKYNIPVARRQNWSKSVWVEFLILSIVNHGEWFSARFPIFARKDQGVTRAVLKDLTLCVKRLTYIHSMHKQTEFALYRQ